MSTEHQQVDATEKRTIDGHRLSEFIYGTVTALVAIAGISTETEASWSNAVAIIVIGAAAVWAAHAYSHAISQRIAGGNRLALVDIGEILRGSWPIVVAGFLVATPFLLVALGVFTMAAALILPVCSVWRSWPLLATCRVWPLARPSPAVSPWPPCPWGWA